MILSADADPAAFRRALRKFRGVEGGDRFLAAEGAIGFVAVADDEIVGWCWGQHIVRPDDTSMMYLHELEVAEEFRRRGLGRALVDAFIAAGSALGASKMFLTTGEANVAARRLYEALAARPADQGSTVNYWFTLRP